LVLFCFQFEAEIEILQTAKKKKNKNENSDKIEEYNVLLEKHRDHVNKLETILRMLDNKTVEISQVRFLLKKKNCYITGMANVRPPKNFLRPLCKILMHKLAI